MNSEPTHFLTFMNNGKAFPSLDGIACSYQCSDQLQLLARAAGKPKGVRLLEAIKNQIYYKIMLIAPGVI